MFITVREKDSPFFLPIHREYLKNFFMRDIVSDYNLTTTVEDSLKDIYIDHYGLPKTWPKADDGHLLPFGIYKPQAIYLRYENENS
jgi:hypothetical protein